MLNTNNDAFPGRSRLPFITINLVFTDANPRNLSNKMSVSRYSCVSVLGQSRRNTASFQGVDWRRRLGVLIRSRRYFLDLVATMDRCQIGKQKDVMTSWWCSTWGSFLNVFSANCSLGRPPFSRRQWRHLRFLLFAHELETEHWKARDWLPQT